MQIRTLIESAYRVAVRLPETTDITPPSAGFPRPPEPETLEMVERALGEYTEPELENKDSRPSGGGDGMGREADLPRAPDIESPQPRVFDRSDIETPKPDSKGGIVTGSEKYLALAKAGSVKLLSEGGSQYVAQLTTNLLLAGGKLYVKASPGAAAYATVGGVAVGLSTIHCLMFGFRAARLLQDQVRYAEVLDPSHPKLGPLFALMGRAGIDPKGKRAYYALALLPYTLAITSAVAGAGAKGSIGHGVLLYSRSVMRMWTAVMRDVLMAIQQDAWPKVKASPGSSLTKEQEQLESRKLDELKMSIGMLLRIGAGEIASGVRVGMEHGSTALGTIESYGEAFESYMSYATMSGVAAGFAGVASVLANPLAAAASGKDLKYKPWEPGKIIKNTKTLAGYEDKQGETRKARDKMWDSAALRGWLGMASDLSNFAVETWKDDRARFLGLQFGLWAPLKACAEPRNLWLENVKALRDRQEKAEPLDGKGPVWHDRMPDTQGVADHDDDLILDDVHVEVPQLVAHALTGTMQAVQDAGPDPAEVTQDTEAQGIPELRGRSPTVVSATVLQAPFMERRQSESEREPSRGVPGLVPEDFENPSEDDQDLNLTIDSEGAMPELEQDVAGEPQALLPPMHLEDIPVTLEESEHNTST